MGAGQKREEEHKKLINNKYGKIYRTKKQIS